MVIDKLTDGLPRLRDFLSLSEPERQNLFTEVDKRVARLSAADRKTLAIEMMESLGIDLIRKLKKLVGREDDSPFFDENVVNENGLACGIDPITIRHPTVRAIVDGYKDGPKIRSWNSTKASAYFPHFDAVYLAPPDAHLTDDMTAADRLSVKYGILFHELVHSTGAKHRLNRPWLDVNSDAQSHRHYHLEEMIAEMGSGMILDDAGLMTEVGRKKCDGIIAHYAQGFQKHENMSESQARQLAFPYAREAAEHILGKRLPSGVGRWARGRNHLQKV